MAARPCPTRRSLLAALLAGPLVPLHRPARAADKLLVVVPAQSPVRAISRKELLALYTGRSRVFPGGEVAVPLDQARDSAARAAFYEALAGMDLARINSYWARLHFTNQVQPPRAVADDAAMLQQLRSEPLAIGYLTREPTDATLRVLLTLP